MTDWTPGVKADATRVCDLLTDRYANPTKNSIRKWVIAELKAAEPTLVLDLWGGGLSAAEMTAAGLPVLSVDDGRSFVEFGITKPRGKRALTVKGELDGYRTGWGSVAKYLPECDAAWLDFMGHPCHETERALDACKGKKIVVLTLMASRNAGHEGMSVESYIMEFEGLIEGRSGLRVRIVRKYRRPDGQWVLVFLARANIAADNKSASQRWHWRHDADHRSHELARQHKRRADPEFRAARNERDRVGYAARMADPEYRERRTEQNRAYHAAYHAAHRDEISAYQAAHRDERAGTRRAYRASHLEQRKAYVAAHRDEINAQNRASRARKKAERLAAAQIGA